MKQLQNNGTRKFIWNFFDSEDVDNFFCNKYYPEITY